MKHLTCCAWYTYLHIFFGAELQITFQPCGGMFRPLAVITMRQEYHQSAITSPFGFTGTDELVKDHLGTVGEITELRFPDHQRVGFGAGVSIFISQYGLFRKCGIDYQEIGLLVADMLQGQVSVAGFLIMYNGMPVKKRTTSAVLSG